MPSDKHNSRTARARDLISSLINVASSRDVPFHQPQLLQCFMAHFSSTCILCIFCYGWMDCRDTFHAVLCLYCCVMNTTKLNMKHTGLSVIQKLIVEAHISYFFPAKWYMLIRKLKLLCFQKSKQTSIRKNL